MRYCINCLQPDTRPGTYFSTDGICPACDYAASLTDVDWELRRRELSGAIRKVIERNPPSSAGASHDCVIGVSGGKDSTRQAIWVRDVLGFNPLLVCVTYAPQQQTVLGNTNLENLLDLGFDLITVAPGARTWRDGMRSAFFSHANWAKSTELALYAGVPRIALDLGINVMLWGENLALQWGDMSVLGETGYDGNRLRYLNTLGGAGNEWLLDAGIPRKNLLSYEYPSNDEFQTGDLQVFFLGWALGDWGEVANGVRAGLSGLHFRMDDAHVTGDPFGTASLDEDFVIVNQMIKYYKYGFGRATEYANELIREGRTDRTTAIGFVKEFDGVCGESYVEDFCRYLEISTQDFWETVLAVTNSRLFDTTSKHGRPEPRFTVGVNLVE